MSSSREPSRTVHAQQAMELSDLFSYKFAALRFGRTPVRRLKLQEPDGPSTAGGRHARQSLVLVSDDDPHQSLVVGWVDTTMHRSEVKSLKSLDQVHQARFGRALDLEPPEWERLLAELRGFLRIHRIDVWEVDAAPAAPVKQNASNAPTVIVPRPQLTTPSPWPLAAAAFAAGVAVGLVLGYAVFGS
ncbi:MAG: hypothetical protein KC933_27195 [Myxococcales bacterium]|nr:hypothetical protein [Myxococcales bacterium]MCB9649539.1 hypothetical protein [Deltaproteobacteria bacterium]